MLRQASGVARSQKSASVRCTGRINARARAHTSSSNATRARPERAKLDFRLPLAGLAGSVTAAAVVYSYARVRPVLNEATPDIHGGSKKKVVEPTPVVWDDEHLLALAWGSNRCVFFFFVLLSRVFRFFE